MNLALRVRRGGIDGKESTGKDDAEEEMTTLQKAPVMS
jgi:hypothetical protein